MKKVFIVITLLLCIMLNSCALVNIESQATSNNGTTDESPKVEFCTVTFDSLGGSPVTAQLIKKGEKAREPNPPTKKCRCEFDGWYLGDEKWSFIGYTVTEDITLTAKWIDCFGLSDKEYEIIKDLKIFKDKYTWADIENIKKYDSYLKDAEGNMILDYEAVEYKIIFKDGYIYTITVQK